MPKVNSNNQSPNPYEIHLVGGKTYLSTLNVVLLISDSIKTVRSKSMTTQAKKLHLVSNVLNMACAVGMVMAAVSSIFGIQLLAPAPNRIVQTSLLSCGMAAMLMEIGSDAKVLVRKSHETNVDEQNREINIGSKGVHWAGAMARLLMMIWALSTILELYVHNPLTFPTIKRMEWSAFGLSLLISLYQPHLISKEASKKGFRCHFFHGLLEKAYEKPYKD
ncbi:MAG: hypothetical protein VXZ72_04925 [Chlamydiota bacterium]|nr:hypothetical protein [Chlamydiota bacterium]